MKVPRLPIVKPEALKEKGEKPSGGRPAGYKHTLREGRLTDLLARRRRGRKRKNRIAEFGKVAKRVTTETHKNGTESVRKK